ncbi:hypothetical protein JY438_05165 [Stenotrophomonas maltophilia]|uniref:hypothetical protein n=1 Tax=Stenotrophomonas TaxID=40323 RepID=UPI0005BDBA84|nr:MULTISPECIES: hypothetical protein [Stenotrophomonas]HCL44796.1 hypothetical protein [Pseudomonas sp.]MBN4995151.1 hypothetical protein [Stenotrophomonas maltophilia]MCR1806391.1 hypothetical protein [Stenotrophomonas geniculata]MCU1145465.1 hypothetical protein [Stenotrophomonas maltophilia]HDX0924598.1 hypothetical protein [Stenotrophomonas maltophilia]
MEVFFSTLGALGVWLIALAVLALVVMGLLMPFAVFGIKPLLRVLIEEQRRNNRLLARQGLRDQGIEAGDVAGVATSKDDSEPQTLQDFIRERSGRSP